jgi:hypothetical protein
VTIADTRYPWDSNKKNQHLNQHQQKLISLLTGNLPLYSKFEANVEQTQTWLKTSGQVKGHKQNDTKSKPANNIVHLTALRNMFTWNKPRDNWFARQESGGAGKAERIYCSQHINNTLRTAGIPNLNYIKPWFQNMQF